MHKVRGVDRILKVDDRFEVYVSEPRHAEIFPDSSASSHTSSQCEDVHIHDTSSF